MLGWLSRKKVSNLSLKTPDGWGLFSKNTQAGVSVSVESAMRIAAVYACVKIIAETIGSTPLHIYERRSDGGKDRADNHPLALIFGGVANKENTTQELIEYVMSSLLLRGTAYCEIVRTGGRVTALIPLDSACMTVMRDDSGALYFDYTVGDATQVYKPNELWRITGLSSDGITGYSNVSQGKEALGVAIAAETHASKTFSNGASIPGVFQKEGLLTDEGFARLKEQLDSRADSLGNLMKPLLLEEGLSYESISMTLRDAQFIEARKFQIAEVARIFRVPLHKLNEMDNSTFSNIEHQALEFVVDTLTPWCTRIEQTISRDLLTAGEKSRYYAKFNLDGLLRGDVKSRYEAHASALVHGWKSRNEVRELEDLNPVDGLDEYLVPLNMGSESDQENNSPEAQMEALERRQYNAIRREIGRNDFEAWATDYYSRLADSIDADEATAKEYCDTQLAKVLAADDVASLIKEWK